MNGFRARGMGWVGRQPTAAQDSGNIGAVLLQTRLDQHAGDARTVAEHGATVKRELLACVPVDVAQHVRATAAETARLAARVRETSAALQEHLAYEPGEDELEDWLLEKLRLEGVIPHLRRLYGAAVQEHNAALAAARQSVAAACRERGEAMQAAHRAFAERQRLELEAVNLMFRAEREGISRAGMLTAADLE